MTLPEQIKKESIKKIVKIANKILKEEINLALGCRQIYRLKGNTDDSDNEIYNIFILVASDTDHIPLDQHVRKIWNKNALKELDKELDEYIQDMKLSIITACEKLIRYYKKK